MQINIRPPRTPSPHQPRRQYTLKKRNKQTFKQSTPSHKPHTLTSQQLQHTRTQQTRRPPKCTRRRLTHTSLGNPLTTQPKYRTHNRTQPLILKQNLRRRIKNPQQPNQSLQKQLFNVRPTTHETQPCNYHRQKTPSRRNTRKTHITRPQHPNTLRRTRISHKYHPQTRHQHTTHT